MQTKMMYLHNAYLAALEYLPSKKTWKQCCEVAIRELNAVGIDKINNPETIMRWNGMFRNYEKFAHPNLEVELNRLYLPPFLDIYPDAKEDICKWCSKNIESLSSEKLANYIRDELIPKLY